MVAITVLVVDDHPEFRGITRQLLQSDPGIVVVGEASNGREAVELTSQFRPDVVVMDIKMPEMNGIEAASAIRQQWPITHVILMTGLDAGAYRDVARLCGAAAFVAKENLSTQLLVILHRLVRVV